MHRNKPCGDFCSDDYDDLEYSCAAEQDSAVSEEAMKTEDTTGKNAVLGEEIGNYVIKSLLGQGALSKVYRAHPKGLENTSVAIKVIKNKSAAEFFTREASLLDKLDHPNIVKILGVDMEHDPQYLVLEDGGISLREMMTRDTSDSIGVFYYRSNYRSSGSYTALHSAAIKIVTQTLDALSHAHAQGIYHCDVKPENLLWKKDVVKLTDFNIATATQSVGPLEDILHNTQLGTRVSVQGDRVFLFGTPGYAAPEQLSGGAPSEKADSYSAAVVLYELLTGEHPVGSYKKPSKFYTTNGIPRWLDDVIDKALSPNPKDRYTAKEFKQVLNDGLEGKFDVKPIPPRVKESRIKKTVQAVHTALYSAAATSAHAAYRAVSAPVRWTRDLWKQAKYDLAIPSYSCGIPVFLALFGIPAIWASVGIGVYSAGLGVQKAKNEVLEYSLRRELTKNPESGRIAFATGDGKIHYVDAKDILSTTVEKHTVYTGCRNINKLVWTPEGNLVYFSNTQRETSGSTFFSLNPMIYLADIKKGETKKLFSFADYEAECRLQTNILLPANVFHDIAILEMNDKEYRIFMNVNGQVYSINSEGKDLREEKIVSSNLFAKQSTCPDNSHKIADISSHLVLQRKNGLGTIELPTIEGSQPTWYHPKNK